MNEFAYRPGTWQIVVEDGGVVAVPEDVPADRVAALHRMLREGAPRLTDVIDVLSGGSIAALGSFAVVLTTADAVRLAVRGPVSIRVSAADADETVSGEELTTWTERFIAGPRGFALTVGDPVGDAWYPIRSGAVLAAAVRGGEEGPQATEAHAAEESAAEESAAEEPQIVAPAADDPVAADAPTEEVSTEEAPAEEAPADAAPEEAPADEEDADSAISSPDIRTLIPTEVTDMSEIDDATVLTDAPPVAQPGAAAQPSLGDHDGSTVSLAEMRRLRAPAAESEAAPPTAGPDAPTAVLPTVDAPSTAHGVVRLSTGQVIDIDRTIIVGRRPRSTRASGESMPHLVAVDSPQQDISRNHLEIRPEGDSVVVIDLHTTNGSTLLRPGADPVRLHPGEQTLVLTGDVVDLGDGVTLAFEGLT